MLSKSDLIARAEQAGIVPVLTIEDSAQAVPLAKALCAGGLDVLEVTLRTEAGLEAIRAIADSDIDCVIGAGTIVTAEDVEAAASFGAEFLVTPGTPASLVPTLQAFEGVVIPGISTVGEAMTLAEAGFDVLKFFPAEPAGGAPFLKGLGGPLPGLKFMPTGGIKQDTMDAYLKLDNVIAVGGSWIATNGDIAAGDWNGITAKARSANLVARALA